MDKIELEPYFREQGYEHVRLINGKWSGVTRIGMTSNLTTNMDEYGYERLYRYSSEDAAVEALKTWDGEGNPPGEWIEHSRYPRT